MRVLIIGLLVLLATSVQADSARYLDVIPVFWAELYPEGGEDLYCGQGFERRDPRVNIEHVYPMGWVTKALSCGTRKQCRRKTPRFNAIESDLHNLYPALRDINETRGSLAFAEIKGERWVSSRCDFEIDKRRRRVEPRQAVRGDIARSMLYMEWRHGLKLYKKQRALLLAWHRDDPPDAHERWRNDQIERLQGNRNPFIDRANGREKPSL